MMTPPQEAFVEEHAYVPEHLMRYVAAISGGEAFLAGDYLCFVTRGKLIVVGYPLRGVFRAQELVETVENARNRLGPEQVSIIAPEMVFSGAGWRRVGSDRYYRCDLSDTRVRQKARNMVRRAGRDLRVERGQEIAEEHRQMVGEFLADGQLDEKTRVIFERIPQYLHSTRSARVFGARDQDGRLVAFTVGEFGARDYAFYMFNFKSRTLCVPGASDLLLDALIQEARVLGKRFVNLGLGIKPGVEFFKEKWGGFPFLSYQHVEYRLQTGERSGIRILKLLGHLHDYLSRAQPGKK